ncbi:MULTISPECIES: hypothetical protein [Streptomyces]|uniref:hypothetical protein n=1 Tax=Streptomyces TaxID=1883 RepID=UPI0019B75219|nr:hypothetical protein [Streptomyces abikoensis]GGP68746.1 hypothetical protein GCM10010214_48970 [Streptomyces abikoensis]
MVNATLVRPAPERVSERAREILSAIEADPEFERLRTGCAKYDKDWQSFTGYALVDGFDVEKDTVPLFPEALRAMAIKSAVYEMTDGDEYAAEIPVSVPVDEMIHALAAQFTVLSRVQERTGIKFVHATDREEIGGWDHGDYTHQVYRAAWGPVNERFWIGKDETEKRRAAAIKKYEPLGIFEGGRRFAPGFATAS